MLRRTKNKVTESHIGDELQQGFDHLRSAASMAADITAERLAPAMESARDTMGPRMRQAQLAAMQAWDTRMRRTADAEASRKMSRRAHRKARARMAKSGYGGRPGRRMMMGRGMMMRAQEPPTSHRWRWMMGAIGIGAAVGAIGALISRRNRADWEQYESGGAMSGTVPSSETPAGTHSKSTREKVTDMADAAKRKASEAMNTVRDRSGKSFASDEQTSTTTPSEPAVTGPTVRPGQAPEDRPPMS